MKVRKIELRGVTTFDDATVELPAHGIVLVTGANGTGKSTLIEAVSMAGWNDTLRGPRPWREDTKGASLTVTLADGTTLTRTPKPTPESRTFAGEVFETQMKQLAAVAEVLGTQDVWRRTHVFSSEDATKFTSSTDLERKEFLEAILGLDRFDVAFDEATAAVKRKAAEVQRATATVDRTRNALEVAQARIEELAKLRDEPRIDRPDDAEKLIAERAEMKRVRTEIDETLETHQSERAELAARAEEARRWRRRLDAKTCPTCLQPIPARVVSDADATVTEAEMAAEKHLKIAEGAIEKGKALRERTAKTIEALTMRIEQHKAAHRAWESQQERLAALDENLERYRRQAFDVVGQLEEEEEVLDALAVELATLEAARKVLSVGGVRAYLLSRSLDTITEMANVWLARLCTDRVLELKLSPYTEKARGGIKESIALEVVGAGGGHGYKAASGGERRRIDLAILFALSEVASAAHNRAGGTLWMDEVFDALDVDGVAAVCDALRQLAEDRCVVVITHSDTIQQHLVRSATRRYHLERNGASTKIGGR